jgi:DUF971 family protein
MVVVMLILPLSGVILAADPTAEASRTIAPKVVQPGEAVGITVVFRNLLTEPRAFALMEVIPAGWGFTRGSDDASAFRPGPPPEWVWFTVGAGATKTVTYTLSVPIGTQAGNYAIGGTVTGASVENPVGGDTTITVIVRYGLTMSAAPGAGGTATDLTGGSPYVAGTTVNIKAVPAGGYQFVNWTAPAGVFANAAAAETTFTMPAQDVTVTANFATLPPLSYQLTVSGTSGGSVTTPGIGTFTYSAGTVVNLVAGPSAGYQFVNWTGNVGTVANPNAASTTITMNGNYSVTANFATLPPSSYQLTISSTSGGSVTTPGIGTFTYAAGTVVNLVANPSAGYQFVNWTGNVATVANPNAASTTITMNGNYSVTANFATLPPSSYQLTISSTSGGSVTTPGIGTFTYAAGTVVNLVASPSAGYQFVNWTDNVATVANPNAASTTITMNGNYSVTANFATLPPSPVYPTVTTQAATNTTTNSAILGMNYTVGSYSSVQVRFAYKKSTDSAWPSTTWVSKSADGTHATPVTGLTSATKYDFKAQLKYDNTVIESFTLQFTTATPPPSREWCFIATAAYGTPMAEEIQILREFRDECLLTNSVGQAFVDFYYRVSPPIAEFIVEHPSLKPMVRVGLAPAVAISTLAVSTAPAEKAAVAGLLLFVSMVLVVRTIKRRGRGRQHTCS